MVHSKIISEAKQNFGASFNIVSKAKELRKNMTEHEKILWGHLRKRQLKGMHFRRQHPYGIYILDFYCFQTQLVIELDGLIHMRKRQYDKERTKYLESSGLMVLRFTNEDVDKRLEWVLKEIEHYLDKLRSSHPSPLGEG